MNDQFFDHLVHLRRLGRKPLDVPPDSAKGYRRVRNRIKKVRNRVRRYGIAQIIREIAISSEIRRSGYEDE